MSNIAQKGLPLVGLLALAAAAFITLLTEIMPAGLLAPISKGLEVPESLAGQFITAFAIGAVMSAIPAMSMTRNMNRKPLLMVAICGFAIVNAITAVSTNFALSMVARFLAGVFGGVVWSLLAGYAVRMAPAHLHGRAIAITSAGATAALVFGVPAGTALGAVVGWQGAFGAISVLAVALVLVIACVVPDFPGQTQGRQETIREVVSRSGVLATIAVILTFVAAHNIFYIYLGPYLESMGSTVPFNWILLLYGFGSIGGLLLAGAVVDRSLPTLGPLQIIGFAVAAVLLHLVSAQTPMLIQFCIVFWGLSFGGFAALAQTAMSRLAGNSVDLTQAMSTTAWNIAVASGGVVGGALLQNVGAQSFPWAVLVILVASLAAKCLGTNRALALARQ